MIDLTQPAPRVRSLDEAQGLIKALWRLAREKVALIERKEKEIAELTQRIMLLEEKLATNSRNSSRPPSSDQTAGQPVKPRAGSGRKAGGQPGHAGRSRTLLPLEQVTQTHVAALSGSALGAAWYASAAWPSSVRHFRLY